MIIQKEEMGKELKENLRGGNGAVEFMPLAGKALPPKCRLFSVISLEKGCSIGRHEHVAEAEIYYVLEGEGMLDDNGTQRAFKKGDCHICPAGQSHAIANEKDESLKFIAAIILD